MVDVYQSGLGRIVQVGREVPQKKRKVEVVRINFKYQFKSRVRNRSSNPVPRFQVSEMNRLMDLSDANSTIRFVQAVVCGRNSTTLLDTEHGPAQRIEEFREQINSNLQQSSQNSDKKNDDKYVYDNATCKSARYVA